MSGIADVVSSADPMNFDEAMRKAAESVWGDAEVAGQKVYGGMREAYKWLANDCHWQGVLWAADALKHYKKPCKGPEEATEAYEKFKYGCKEPYCPSGFKVKLPCDTSVDVEQGFKGLDPTYTCEMETPTGSSTCGFDVNSLSEPVSSVNAKATEACGKYMSTANRMAATWGETVSGSNAQAMACPSGFYQDGSVCKMACSSNTATRDSNGNCHCDEGNPCAEGFECMSGVCHNPGVTCPLMGFCPDGWTLVLSQDGVSRCVARNVPHGKCNVVSHFPNNWTQSQRQAWTSDCQDSSVTWSNTQPLCMGQRAPN